MWGVFEVDNSINVAPVGDGEEIKTPHILDELCICEPEVKAENNMLIIIHKEEQ